MKRSLTITVILLFAVWLASLAILLCFLADIVGIPALVAAIVAQIGVAAVSAALLLVTNTRRPWGADAYAATTDELLRPAVMVGDRPYGRRAHDDRNVVDRLSDILEEEASLRKPGETPAWVLGINQRHDAAASAFGDAPKEEHPNA